MAISKYGVFVDVVKFKSLSQAAYYHNYTVPAVSQIIKGLEKDLGLTLLNRSHAGVSLTADGEHLYPFIETLAKAETNLNEEASRILSLESGTIRIGTFSSVSFNVLVPLLRDFKQEYPKIRIELRHGDNFSIENMLSRGTVDLGILDLPTSSDFTTYPILKDPFVAVLPENHPCAKLDTVPLDIYEKYPVILFDEDTNKEAAGVLRKHKIHTMVEYMSADDRTILSMIEEGMCIGFMGRMILRRTDYKIAVKPTVPECYREIAFAVKNPKELSLAMRCFLDYALENIKKYTKELDNA